MLPTLTPEERAVLLKKARETRAAKTMERKASEHLLKLQWMDSPNWERLASEHKVRMPPTNEPCSLKRMRTYLNRVKLSGTAFNNACTSLEYFMSNNSHVPLFAFVGMCLELKYTE